MKDHTKEEFTEVYVIRPIFIKGTLYNPGQKVQMPNSQLRSALWYGRVSLQPVKNPNVGKKKDEPLEALEFCLRRLYTDRLRFTDQPIAFGLSYEELVNALLLARRELLAAEVKQ